MLLKAVLHPRFWEAIVTATYIQNYLPTETNDKTPYELWNNRKSDLPQMKYLLVNFKTKGFYAYIGMV